MLKMDISSEFDEHSHDLIHLQISAIHAEANNVAGGVYLVKHIFVAVFCE